jgi:hypothetical protein
MRKTGKPGLLSDWHTMRPEIEQELESQCGKLSP